MCILEKLNFKISRGSMLSDRPSVLAPLALNPIFAGLTLNCFCQACCYQWVILSIILRILRWLEIVSWRARPGPLIARARASTPGSRRCKFSNLVPSKILQNLYFDRKYL